MKNSMEITKKELLYQIRSKNLFIVTILTMVITLFHLYGLCANVTNSYHTYLQTEQMYKDNGMDIISALEEENYTVVNGNSQITSNPLKEDFVNLAVSIQNLDRENIISTSLEYFIFVFGTLIFGIYAAYVATYDYKYKTHKFFSIKYKQREIVTGKLLSVLIVLLFSLFLMSILSYIASPVLKYLVGRSVPVDKYVIPGMSYDTNLALQLCFTIAFLGFYIVISYTVGLLFKNMFPITIFLLLYTLLIPVLGKYDIKNIFSFFAHKIFAFKARFAAFQPTEISNATGIAILVFMLMAACILMAASSKRSLYN